MQSYGMLLGVLMIVGFAMSVINGMLYKIVPFLVWFHLQSRRGPSGADRAQRQGDPAGIAHQTADVAALRRIG